METTPVAPPVVPAATPSPARKPRKAAVSEEPGLEWTRSFCPEGQDPYATVEWEQRDAVIGDASGHNVFEQRNVEVPASWSQTATNVVVSKYFRGHLGTDGRERSLRPLIGRVCDTITDWGTEDGYFADDASAQAFRDDLTWLCLHQHMAFNSPVWFNVGVETEPQCSACFINSVDDTMESILDLAKTEGMLFKWGSGTGTNFSSLRSCKEPLGGGGTASGPVSFMRGFDAFAGVIKSGGKTRRAAKMVILDVDHPDIGEFINCKSSEEQKAWALIDAGYGGGFNVPGGAYDSVFFQNSNNSVRVTDAFMEAVLADGEWTTRARTDGTTVQTLKARDLMVDISEAARVGNNELVIKVVNTWDNRILGEIIKFGAKEAIQDAKQDWFGNSLTAPGHLIFAHNVKGNLKKPLSAGLLGPVQLVYFTTGNEGESSDELLSNK